ncbi:MAG: hypothetical protein ACWGOW_03055 [Gammaproteobacteria bacterium]
MNKASPSSPWHDRLRDSAAIALLFLTNPALYLAGMSSGSFSPDSIAYLAMGRLFHSGNWTLFLQGWGHVDNGLILPPLYPLLLAAGSSDFMGLAESISWVALLLSAVPLYLLLKPRSGRVAAVAGVFALQLNGLYFIIGFVPLTEALFTLLLLTALLILDRFQARPSAITAALLGLTCALLWFSRQIGLVFLPFVTAWLFLAPHQPSTSRWGHIGWFAALFLLVSVPYWFVLHLQTGMGPLTQNFSLGRYSVERPSPPSAGPSTEPHSAGYAGILEARQQLRRLLPDGSEMIGWVKTENAPPSGGGMLAVIGKLVSNPAGWLGRLAGNLISLSNMAGWVLSALFLLSLLLPVVSREGAPHLLRRYLPAAALLTYLGGVSLFTDAIPRYTQVMLPLLVVSAVGEGAWSANRWLTRRLRPQARVGVVLLVLLAIAAFPPARYQQVPLQPRLAENAIPLTSFRQWVRRNEPLFAPQPLYAYLAGGMPRTLPIGTLEQVVTYGRRTGVPWLLMVSLDPQKYYATGYLENDWYGRLDLARLHPQWLAYCGATENAVLYRIRSVAAEGEAQITPPQSPSACESTTDS